ncbi:MAG: hypothetical protein NC489_18035 [Ruminococcus flavefaciens]|nr:hypothetical protein [Ruminococcus flavefaciens]
MTHVFIRQNVEQKTRQDEHTGGQLETYYEYDEVQLTKLEYQQYVNENLTAENEALKAQVAEQAEAMVELAGLFDELNTKSDEQAEALVELAGMQAALMSN